MTQNPNKASYEFWDRSQLITQVVTFGLLLLFIVMTVYNANRVMELEKELESCNGEGNVPDQKTPGP